MPDSTQSSVLASRTARFAQFLRAAVAVKAKVIDEVNKYPMTIWFGQLPQGLAEIRSPLLSEWNADDPRWLVVRRTTEPPRPPAPEACELWLDGVDLDTPDNPPALAIRDETNEQGDRVVVDVTGDVRSDWERYVGNEWQRWAEKAKVARAVSPFYRKLFAAYQEMQGRDDAYDLFIGVGLLHLRVDAESPVRRHLLAFPAELSFDAKSGAFTVSPSADFDRARLEDEFLPTDLRVRLQQVAEDVGNELVAVSAALHDRDQIAGILTALVHNLHPAASYVDTISPADASKGEIRSSFAPALVMRPRSTRSILELLSRIEKSASDETEVAALPIPWRRVLEDQDVWAAGGTAVGGNGTSHRNGRIYFPLPSNEEQLKIIRRSEGTAGVVVQGPPGTGKSHTIANLISHYLAIGKRVLVTAETAQALSVLRDKLPKDLQALCVSLLGATSASDKELQKSVKGILNRRQEIDDPSLLAVRAERRELELAESEAKAVSFERLLRDARTSETDVTEPVVGYRGSRGSIARRVRDERPLLGWIPDEIHYDRPLSKPTMGWIAMARHHLSLTAPVRAGFEWPCPAPPFTCDEAVRLLEAIHDARNALVQQPDPAAPPIVGEFSATELDDLGKWLEGLSRAETGVAAEDSGWCDLLRAALLRDALGVWRALRDEASTSMTPLTDSTLAQAVRVETKPPANAIDARAAVARLSDHFRAGGGRRLLGVLKPRVVKETEWVEEAVTVEGSPLRSADDVHRARQAFDAWRLLGRAWDVWAGWPTARTGSPSQQAAFLSQRLATLHTSVELGSARSALSPRLGQWLSASVAVGAKTEALIAVCLRKSAERLLAEAIARRDVIVAQLDRQIAGRDVAPVVMEIRRALMSESVQSLRSAFDRYQQECGRRETHQLYLTFICELEAVAPRLAKTLTEDEGTDRWQARCEEFEKAWDHRRVASWLSTVTSAARIEATERALRDERSLAQDLLRDIAADRAWHAALVRIDDQTRANLVAWIAAVQRIPATGKTVFQRRRVARSYLSKCLQAIPAWVVSLGRLYETVDPKPGMFDVAIVDEASQCWLDSLTLFYLAKQMIVVGDDKQISPTIVGVQAGHIDKLAEVILSDFAHRGSFTIDSSLFDHAQRYLPAGVPLREHFRCVPEIIRFSNELCYGDGSTSLIPLRQVGRDRLAPLKTAYLPNGTREGDKNLIEAKAVACAIEECDRSDEYEDSTFGVICLQGEEQAALIQRLVLERLGPGVFEKRRLRCGSPYAFQGDERNIIFLSMVTAPNWDSRPLTGRMFEQRFNVAASRAQDQLWLFHSVQEQDLSPLCLRRRLLEFFRSPEDGRIRGVAVDIPQLQHRALRADRRVERPPSPFDSWFEIDVALALAARGYKLSAQLQVAHRRIDLVIELEGSRLAVECDGEFWHGPERFAEDRFRQQQLERAGWRFVRVQESVFYYDENLALSEVVATCAELGSEPGGKPSDDAEEPLTPNDVTSPIDQAYAALGGIAPRVTPLDADGAQSSTMQTVSRVRVGSAMSDPTEEVPSAVPNDETGSDEESGASLQSLTDEARRGPFTGYGSKDFPDPRIAPPANVRDAVLEIIKCDGPLPKASVYRLYRDGCPKVERAGKSLRQSINRALLALQRSGKVELRDEGDARVPADVVVKMAGQPWVVVRDVGGRELDDVPLSELAEVLILMGGGSLSSSDDERQELLRRLARRYKIQRLRQQVLGRLEAALKTAMLGVADQARAPRLL